MNKLLSKLGWLVLGMLMLPGLAAAAQSGKPDALRIALVTFFSGSGAVVGGPSVNAAKLTIEQINEAGGINGVPIEAQYVDESGGPTRNVAKFRQLAGEVDVVLGYVSSSDCLAVAPVAEELKVPTIFSACTTNALFEENDYQWVFRTQAPASANALAAALYIAKMGLDVGTIAGINQDYAFGRDQWKYFTAAMQALMPDVEIGSALFAKLFSGSYTSQISRLLAMNPDMVYSSFWGGDLVAFIQQARARGLFSRTQGVLSLGTQGGVQGVKLLPEGVIVGSEHSFLFHPGEIENQALAEYIAKYKERYGNYPVSTYPYTSRRAILALKTGYEKAIAENGGQWPTPEQFIAALEGLKVETLMGPMLIRTDHQAIYHEKYGISVTGSKYPFTVFNKIITFPPELIMPPVENTNAAEWISSLTPEILDKVPEPKVYETGQ